MASYVFPILQILFATFKSWFVIVPKAFMYNSAILARFLPISMFTSQSEFAFIPSPIIVGQKATPVPLTSAEFSFVSCPTGTFVDPRAMHLTTHE